MPEKTISVTLCYAQSPQDIRLRAIRVPEGYTIAQAIAHSEICQEWTIEESEIAGTGIFGIRQPDDYVLQDGDRIELYRGLTFDPMESRRRRAAHRKAGILKRKHLKKSKVAWQEYMDTSMDVSGDDNNQEKE